MKTVNKLCILFSFLLLISGCATLPPSSPEVKKSSRCVVFLDDTSYPINSRDKDMFFNMTIPFLRYREPLLELTDFTEELREIKEVIKTAGCEDFLYRYLKAMNSSGLVCYTEIESASTGWGMRNLKVRYKLFSPVSLSWTECGPFDHCIDAPPFNNAIKAVSEGPPLNQDSACTLLSFLYADRPILEKINLADLPFDRKAYLKGVKNFSQRQFDIAEVSFRKMVLDNPNHPLGNYGLGRVYYEKGEYKNAVMKFEKVLELDPNDYVALHQLGLTYIRLGEFEKAQEVLKKTLQINPRYEAISDALAMVDIEVDKVKKAQEKALGIERAPAIAVISMAAAETELGPKVTDMFITGLAQTGKFRVIERSQLDKILQEQKLSITGAIDQSTAIEIGKLIGANFIVMGSIARLGASYEIDARLISTQTGEVLLADSISSTDESELRSKINDLTMRMGEVEVTKK